MANIHAAFLFSFVIVAGLLASTHGAKPSRYSMPFNRTSFPKDFVFGAGTAAYQSEGAAYIDGKGPSVWDTFTKQHPVAVISSIVYMVVKNIGATSRHPRWRKMQLLYDNR